MRSNVAMSHSIRIRVFKDEKQSLEKTAREKGMSVSELIRSKAWPELARSVEA